MGSVYEVEHEQLGVHYALKAFTAQSGYVDVLKKKFLAEGKVLARLRDSHLIRVFDLDIDEATGVPYFVMDMITYKDGTPHTLDDVELEDLEEDYILTGLMICARHSTTSTRRASSTATSSSATSFCARTSM